MLSKFGKWASLIAAFLLGMLVALPFGAPLFSAKFPDGVPELWGAALGAALAVAGSVLVINWQQHRAQRDAARITTMILTDLRLALQVYARAADASAPTIFQRITDIREVLGRSTTASLTIDTIRGNLGPEALFQLLRLIETIGKFQEALNRDADLRQYSEYAMGQHPNQNLANALVAQITVFIDKHGETSG